MPRAGFEPAALAVPGGMASVVGWSGPQSLGLMPRAGFEPAAYSLGGSRSIQLSYRGAMRLEG